MSESKRDIEVTILLKEYEMASLEIHTRISTNEKVMGLGLTILGVGLTLAIKDQINEVLLFLPVGFFGVFFYALLNNTVILALGGYCRYLQEKLNSFTGEKLLTWAVATKMVHRNFIVFPLNVIFALILGFSIFISLQRAWNNYRVEFFIGVAVGYGLLLLLLLIALARWVGTFNRAYSLAWRETSQLGTELPPDKSPRLTRH